MRIGSFVAVLLSLSGLTHAAEWPQFRGPHSAGLATDEARYPAEIGPERNVLWKIKLPPGHSSPVIDSDRVYLTAFDDGRLLTIALDRATGKTLWRQEAPHEKLEEIHRIGSYAQPTPATDGERVVSFFGSSGLSCYDRDGKLLWRHRMGPFNNEFGAGSSPIIVDDAVLLAQDHDTDSFLMKLDKHTGRILWRVDRSEFPRNYCTPVIWDVNGSKQVVLAATLRVVGYDFETGEELWTVRGLSRAVESTPVVGSDGNLYLAGWAAGGDETERIQVPPFDQIIAERDRNKNGTLEDPELEQGDDVRRRFSQVDRDKSGSLTRTEYEYYRGLFEISENKVLAIRPGARGEATDTHVMWQYRKLVPFCASPLYLNGLLFTVKDGGILSCLDALTGKPTKQGRLEASGEYYSSPVAGDGKIYLLDDEGRLSVVRAEPTWTVLNTAEFGEPTHATPALAEGRIYLRTAGHLYCFGRAAKKSFQ